MNNKLIFTNVLLLLFSVVLSFFVLELSYRFYLFGVDSFSLDKMNSVHGLGVSGLIKPSNHPEIIYELKPNLNTYLKLATFKTNSKGLRDKDYKLSKSRNIFRVAVIGDSFTMPAGVEIEKSYHSLMEERLNSEQTGSPYQFINFGVGGYNLRQYLGVIMFKAHKYEPDLIIVGFCPTNDHTLPLNKIFEQQYKVKQETYPFYQSFVKKKLEQHLFEYINNNRNIHDAETFSNNQKIYMTNIFSKMKAYSMEMDIPIVILYLDCLYNERYANELRELVENNGLYFVNVSIPFKGKNVNEYWIYATDAHPNKNANRIFAEQLYDYLKNKKLLDKKLNN